VPSANPEEERSERTPCPKGETLSSARAGLRNAVVQERAQELGGLSIDVRGVEAEFRAVPITEAKAVKSVIEEFREKYGTSDVKKYYSKFDVAIATRIVNT
jgi:hypothetical protein